MSSWCVHFLVDRDGRDVSLRRYVDAKTEDEAIGKALRDMETQPVTLAGWWPDTLGGSAANASGGAEVAKDAAALPPAREPVMPTTPAALFEALARELPHWLPSGGEAAGSARAAARIITDRIIAATFRLDGEHDA